jgi:hypothetical protein
MHGDFSSVHIELLNVVGLDVVRRAVNYQQFL